MRERQQLDDAIGAVKATERELDDNIGLIELGEAEGDAAIVAEAEAADRARSREEMARRQVETLLSGEADANDAYLEIHAGAGGTESQDWAQMLLRMYTRWAERHGYKVEILEMHDGEEAGIKSATHPRQGRERLWLAEDRIGRAPAGAHLALRQQRAPPHELRQRLGLSGGRRLHRDRHQRRRRPHRHLPLVGRRRPARQHDRFRRAPHPHPDRHRRRLPERALAAQEPRRPPGRCCAPASTRRS